MSNDAIRELAPFAWPAMVSARPRQGADVNLQELSDKTALHFASLENHAAIVERLIAEGAEVNIKDTEGVTALDAATFRKVDARIIEMLKGAGAVCGTNHHYSK